MTRVLTGGRRTWRRVRRGAWITVGFILIVVGLVGVWIPFTLHLFGVFVVIGAIMVLRNSITWRRRFIRLQRRHPRHVHPLRRLLRRKPEVWPVLWHEALRTERWVVPHRWRRLRRWRLAAMRRWRG
jgi:uncharacterized membrane protein YbaN (DUF454 family)